MNNQVLKLSPKAEEIIDSYLRMRINNKVIICPYFTNIKNIRGGLRVFLGKASAEEIVNEVKFIAQKNKIELSNISEKELYALMSQHNIGIDCSGLAVRVLRAHFKEEKNIDIVKKIKIVSFWKKPWRYLIAKMRPIENISVRTLSRKENSFVIENLSKVLPGDFIVRKDLRHVYIIAKIEKQEKQINKITFIHAPRPKQKDYLGPGIEKQTLILEKNSITELAEKMNQEIQIRRLKV